MQGPNGGDDDDDGDGDDDDDWYIHLVGCICDAEKGTFSNLACVAYRQQKSANVQYSQENPKISIHLFSLFQSCLESFDFTFPLTREY